MDCKAILLAWALLSPLVLEIVNARSPLQFSGRSLLNEEQRAALLKLVQGPNAETKTIVKKSQKAKQRDSNEVQSRNQDDIENGQLDSEGCMKKVVMVEEVEFDTEIKCTHVSQESCFESYTTTFKKTKAEECDESFKKECEIEYHKVPKEEKVETCNEMLTRDCEVDGPQVCSKEYETVCETIYEEHTVDEQVPQCTTKLVEKCMTDQETGEQWCDNVPQRDCNIVTQTSVKLTPKTECRKEVAEVCGPETCPIVKGDRICKDEIKTVIHEVPQESCTMVPRKVCNIVSKIVPTLEPVKHCIEIPKEMCAKSRINPVRKVRPVVRKWCSYDNNNNDVDNGPTNEHLDNTVYLLTWRGMDSNNPVLRSELVNANNGESICHKDYTVSAPTYPNLLSFGLVGESRDLVSCGHTDGNACLVLDVDTGDVTTMSDTSLTNGPRQFASSFLDMELDLSWITVGGVTRDSGGVTDVDFQTRTASLSSNSIDLSFEDSSFSELDNAGDIFEGRGCLLKFAGPGDEPVTFFVSTFGGGVNTAYIVKQGTSSVHKIDDTGDLVNYVLGEQPACGYAVVTESSGPDGPAVGDTVVYWLTRGTTGGTVAVFKLTVPTSSEAAMEAFLSSEDGSQNLSVFFLAPFYVNALQDDTFQFDGEGREITTVWLGDNRSIIFISQSTHILLFDANEGVARVLQQSEPLRRDGMLMAVRATQADSENLGCT